MTAGADTSSDLLISLPDIALLAGVKRPVVSMWRKRRSRTGGSFPAPVVAGRGQELFDAGEIVDWLESTGRGNNSSAKDDLAAFAALRAAPLRESAVFAGVTALLCLVSIAGPLPRNADELLDLADEADPDDEYLYAEIEALQDRLVPLARFASLLANAAYSPAGAFEKLMAERFRLDIDGYAKITLSRPLRDLAVSTALALGTQAELEEVVFVDPTAGGSDLIIDLVRRAAEQLGTVEVATPDSDGTAARLLCRRLRVHGVVRESLRGDGEGRPSLPFRGHHRGSIPFSGPADDVRRGAA